MKVRSIETYAQSINNLHSLYHTVDPSIISNPFNASIKSILGLSSFSQYWTVIWCWSIQLLIRLFWNSFPLSVWKTLIGLPSLSALSRILISDSNPPQYYKQKRHSHSSLRTFFYLICDWFNSFSSRQFLVMVWRRSYCSAICTTYPSVATTPTSQIRWFCQLKKAK